MARVPPAITARYLENVTGWYLERNFTSSSHLRRLLMDRVRRSLVAHGGDKAEAVALVDAEIARLLEVGALDDQRHADDKARSLHARGSSASRIRGALMVKGVASPQVAEAVASLVEDEGTAADVELEAARTWARKRRLGLWRKAPVDLDGRKKELAKMARAGFSYAMAVRIVDEKE